MEILNQTRDYRINAINLLINTSLGEYDDLSDKILKENPFQRKRVKTSSTVYSLLRIDLMKGIVIPPIVLGLSLDIDTTNKSEQEIIEIIYSQRNKLIILDGLQRTYTIRDLINELKQKNDPQIAKVSAYPLRIEIYVGINKLGILYRMLTLNTGQTPMSTRHQIEIIYSDYIANGIEGIRLIKQIDEASPRTLSEYSFRDVIDGFTSYLERDYLTIERADILDNIKSLEKLAIENQNKDLFVLFVKAYNNFAKKIFDFGKSWKFQPKSLGRALGGPPFGIDVIDILNKSQVMTGFGSAIGKLVDLKAIEDFDDVEKLIDQIVSSNINDDLNTLILRLDDLRSVAKKIGNDQRIFFHYFFRELFDKKSDAFLTIGESIKQAYSQYERRTKE